MRLHEHTATSILAFPDLDSLWPLMHRPYAALKANKMAQIPRALT